VLRISIALLLVGHGGFALIQEKKILVDQWQSIGVPAGRTFLHVLGIAEMGAAIAVLCRPSRWLLLVIGYWKIASELLYPVSGKLRDVWEWLERGGDYVTPLAATAAMGLHRPAPTAELVRGADIIDSASFPARKRPARGGSRSS